MLWHLSDAWSRRLDPNVVLVHYEDLAADLEGEMRRLAGRLAIPVPELVWPDLVDAAGFEHMRARAEQMAPDPSGVLKNRTAFFRRGTSGAGRELVTEDGLARYRERTERLGTPDLLGWLHRAG